jgi:hypothetical protein
MTPTRSTAVSSRRSPAPGRDRRPQLLTVTGRVRSMAPTPQGHLSCVLDTPAGRLKALSDAVAVHLPELQVGSQVQAVLLRLRRTTPDAVWHWQLLCCRRMDPAETAPTLAVRTAGSHA